MAARVKLSPPSRQGKVAFPFAAFLASQPRTVRILYWFNIAIIATGFFDTIFVFLNRDYVTALTIFLALPFVLISLIFMKARKVELAAIYLACYMILLITLVSTQNLGIHHIGNFAFPGILIVSSLVAKRRTMVLLTMAIIGGLAWLVFGELAGAYTPTILRKSVAGDFFTASAIIILISIMARLISESMFKSNLDLQTELAERRRIEADLSSNIAKQVETEKLLRDALEEKTVLLREKELLIKEVHHRVKNNMQVVSSLLNLQSESIGDPVITSILRDSQNRLHSLSLVHEQLYLSNSLAHMDASSYFRQLVESLIETYSPVSGKVQFHFELEMIDLGIDQAIPCGLIMTELLSNALKHGFAKGKSGNIAIGFVESEGSGILLSVADDGVGIPEGTDWLRTGSLGMQLVNQLTAQLRGTLELTRLTPGTRFSVRFPAVT